MADDTDYEFSVESDTTQAFGPVFKENLDITRIIFDFSCWLSDVDDATSEPISAVIYPIIGLESNTTFPPYQVDYPLNLNTVSPALTDDYPLTVQSVSITHSATEIEVRLSAGTPGLTYVVSVVASAATTKRRKQVDCLVTVEPPLNPNLLSQASPDISDMSPPITISGGDTTLPMGFNGRLYIENQSNAPITITLPVTPVEGQRVAPVDLLGNAQTYPITFIGAAGDNIYSSVSFTSDVNYDDLIFEYVGDHWIILSSRYSFLA